jgi:threonine synthase
VAIRRQSLSRPGLRAFPVSGTFDDCQAIVKSILAGAHAPAPAGLTAVNSVNWGRILAQTAYYARAALLLGHAGRPVHFIVPTGNFGNVYAGLLSRRLGFAVGQLLVATNANDSLHRLVQTGQIAHRPVQRTHSPAMDIQVASNLERLIFDLDGAGGTQIVRGLFAAETQDLPADLHQRLRKSVQTQSISDAETLVQISATQASTDYVADPHTAVALAAAGRVALPPGPVVCLATAHPIKFAETVAQALGRFPPHLDIAAHTAPVPPAPAPIQPDEQSVRDLIAKIIAH